MVGAQDSQRQTFVSVLFLPNIYFFMFLNGLTFFGILFYLLMKY